MLRFCDVPTRNIDKIYPNEHKPVKYGLDFGIIYLALFSGEAQCISKVYILSFQKLKKFMYMDNAAVLLKVVIVINLK